MKNLPKHCAIYTRKSTEEGLDQDFNTLDAQREACLSYVASQKEEGWIALPDLYDDGGYSGGNMDRPALKRLLADIKAKKVNTIVVYKIDRLTRSLADFSKLVEIFEEHDVTFVSITQSFNTTTSMGRLTLNVLLSFAQFEREIIGERVRDKILASKKKGMWMGGTNPLGYQRVNKELVPQESEIALAKMIFERYLRLGCVRRLEVELRRENITSPIRVSSKGRQHGGSFFSRGALYSILRNPVYIGKIRHKSTVYEGLHLPIIDRKIWEEVQKKLDGNKQPISGYRKQNNLLKGKLYDSQGTIYTPTYTSKKGRRYRYYITQSFQKFKDHPDGLLARLPANETDELARNAFRQAFTNTLSLSEFLAIDAATHHDILEYIISKADAFEMDDFIRKCCSKIILTKETMTIKVDCKALAAAIKMTLQIPALPAAEKDCHEYTAPYAVSRARKGAIIIDAPRRFLAKDDPFNRPEHEIQNWVKGTVWREMHFRGKTVMEIAKKEGVGIGYVSRLIDQSLDIR